MKNTYPWLEGAWQSLQGLRARLPNAILIKGAQGIGKFDMAVSFAQSILCEAPLASGLPCKQCDSCRWFEQGTHPDYRLVQPDAISNAEEGSEAAEGAEKKSGKKPSREIGVEQIRALSNFSNLSSHRGGYRIVLIHPAETMNSNSANALLKTLEEPTANLLFILITHKPQQLLPTILSRCLSLTVNTPDQATGISWLKEQGLPNPEQALARSGFAPLQALRNEEEGDNAEDMSVLLTAIQRPAQFDALDLAEKLQRSAPGQVVNCLQQWCYDLANAKLTGRVRYFPGQKELLTRLSSNISAMRLLHYQKELLAAKRAAFHPLNPKLQFEAILLSYRQIFP